MLHTLAVPLLQYRMGWLPGMLGCIWGPNLPWCPPPTLPLLPVRAHWCLSPQHSCSAGSEMGVSGIRGWEWCQGLAGALGLERELPKGRQWGFW